MGDLPDLLERNTKACGKLESAETNLLKTAAKNMLKADKAVKKAAKKGTDLPPLADVEADQSDVSRYVSGKQRPHHKLGFFGLWGEKYVPMSCLLRAWTSLTS